MFNALSLTCSAPSSGSVGISRGGEAASGGSPVPLLADGQPSTITHPDPSRYLRGRRGARRPRRPRSPPFPALRGPGAASFLKCGQVAVAGSPLALPGAAHCSKQVVCSWLMVQIFCPELSHAAPAYMYLKKKMLSWFQTLDTEAGRERAPALLAACMQHAGLCWGPLPAHNPEESSTRNQTQHPPQPGFTVSLHSDIRILCNHLWITPLLRRINTAPGLCQS